MNKQRTDDGAKRVLQLDRIAKVHAHRKITRKFESYILRSIGTRLIPVDRLAGWLAEDKNKILFEIFKIL